MTPRTKEVLRASINEYLANPDKQENYRETVNKQLQEHENAIKHIGMGLDRDYVKAGQMLKRIFKF